MGPLKANSIVRAVLGDTDAAVAADNAAAAHAQARAQAQAQAPQAEGAQAQGAQDEPPPAEREYGGERSVFLGLAGGLVSQPGDGDWTLLYLDLSLTTWMLVQPDAIIQHMEVQDRLSADVKWDLVWVKGTASVGHGSGPVSDAQFLSGDFIRAGDFPATPDGGTFGPEVGVFAAGVSPNCCTRKSR